MKKKIMALLLSACVLVSMMALPALAADLTGHWSANSVNRWVEAGVLTNDDNYNPDAQMTRGEFAKLLADVMGYTESAPASTFVDIAGNEYAPYILKLAAAGVMQGGGAGNANPNATITRQEIAKMMCVAFDIAPSYGATSFADAGSISDWAKGYVAALSERGMLKGVGGNNVDPWGNITHGAMASLLDQSIAHYITADAEITGQVDGFVVVAKNAKVNVKDASLIENLIVAPGAKNADVKLSGSTSVPNVIVAASDAKVTVESGAVVITITVTGGSASVDVSGKVDDLKAEGDNAKIVMSGAAAVQNVVVSAPNGTVTVESDATVSNITVEAGANKSEVNISGDVGTVNLIGSESSVTAKDDAAVGSVNNKGDNNDVNAQDNASIGNVNTSGNNADITSSGNSNISNVTTSGNGSTNVSGDGNVGNVTATGSNDTNVTTGGTTVENQGNGNVTAGGENVPSGSTVTTPKDDGSGATAGSDPCNKDNQNTPGSNNNSGGGTTPGDDPCNKDNQNTPGSNNNSGGGTTPGGDPCNKDNQDTPGSETRS